MKSSTMKALGIAATVIGIGASLLNGFVSGKETDAKIEEKIVKALAEKEKNK